MEGEGYEHGDYDDNPNANHFPDALWSAVHPVFTPSTQMMAAIGLLTAIYAIIPWSQKLSGPKNTFLDARLRNSSQ